MNFAVTQEYIDWLKEAIEDQNDVAILQSMKDEYPADINAVLHQLTANEAKYVMRLLDKKIVAEIISELETDVRKKFLEKAYKPEELAELLDFIDTDDAADILNEQSVKYKEETIAHIQDEQHAANILELLHYDEDCAGGYMQKEMVKANANWTVQECIEEIRRQAEEVEKVYSVYVVDNQDRLLGRIALKKLILTKPQVPVAHIYEKDIISVESYMPIQEVAELMQRYDLEAVHVINVQGKLLGRITIDDIIDAITEQVETDLQAISGISEDTDYEDSAWQGARARLPWLIIGMAGGMLAAMVMGLFEAELDVYSCDGFLYATYCSHRRKRGHTICYRYGAKYRRIGNRRHTQKNEKSITYCFAERYSNSKFGVFVCAAYGKNHAVRYCGKFSTFFSGYFSLFDGNISAYSTQ